MDKGAYARAVVLLLSILLVGHAAPSGLQSSMSINPSDPISATSADLINDPQGRGHLLVRSFRQWGFRHPVLPAHVNHRLCGHLGCTAQHWMSR